MDIQFLTPRSGRMIKEDGTIINIADALAGDAASVGKAPINSYSAASGRMIREDGTVINIADEIANGNIGGEGGGGTSNYNDRQNKPTLNGVTIEGDKTSEDYGIESADRQEMLERSIENYYALRRTGKIYQSKLLKFASNPTISGEKLLDNAGLFFEPSTDSVSGQDDYLNGQNPLFE